MVEWLIKVQIIVIVVHSRYLQFSKNVDCSV